jgi:DNA polymerase/3'-5' exonuclease PolX
MPPILYRDILEQNDLVVVILEHIDYLLKLEGKPSSFGYAAYSISQLKQPLSTMKGELQKIKGVSKAIELVILEILETGSSSYYEKFLIG